MKAFVLMTALPPTKGHRNLIRFAASLGADETVVIVCTQPFEPYPFERFSSIRTAAAQMSGNVRVQWLNKELMQDPATPGFWPMWDTLMTEHGFQQGDYVVSSEAYGGTLAARLGGMFIPYDPNRELYYTKATQIREQMADYFHDILPEFQKHLVTRVTVWGAESTGKTTLSHKLSDAVNGHWLFEWARPYLETVSTEINIRSMRDIWKGQNALQRHADYLTDKPFIIQDTDLYSTIGYWEQPHWQEKLGPVPFGLINDARATKSDLYIITTSSIPFEADPIRYGGDRRESDDDYWISLADKYDLPYVVLEESDLDKRLELAVRLCENEADQKARTIFYDRKGL